MDSSKDNQKLSFHTQDGKDSWWQPGPKIPRYWNKGLLRRLWQEIYCIVRKKVNARTGTRQSLESGFYDNMNIVRA